MAGTYNPAYATFAAVATGSVTPLGPQDNVITVQVGGTYTGVSGTIQVTADPPSVGSAAIWNNVDVLRVDTLALEQSPTWTDSTVRMWKCDGTNVAQVRVNLTAGTLTSGMSVRVQTSYVSTGALAGISYATSVGGNQAITGNVVITSASANALTAGLAGSTNPAFNVDASTASSITGLNIKSAATGNGVAVSALGSTNEPLIVNAKGSGYISLGDTSTGPAYLNRGALAALQVGQTLTGLGTAQSSAPTSAQLLGGLLTQTGATGAGVITLPSGTALSTACNRTPAVGDTFECIFINVAGGQTLTVTGTTGTTVVGGATIATGVGAKLVFYNSGANTWNVYLA